MRTAPVTIVCAGCGQPAKMHSYRLRNGTGKYCSQACYLAHRWDGDRKCKYCGEPCLTRYCSIECQKRQWNEVDGVARKAARNWERKLALISDLGGKCEVCGFADMRALDIDHIDPAMKAKQKTGYTWSRRFRDWEANKGNLRLLCANCHRLHTWEQRGFGRAFGGFDKEIGFAEGLLNSTARN